MYQTSVSPSHYGKATTLQKQPPQLHNKDKSMTTTLCFSAACESVSSELIVQKRCNTSISAAVISMPHSAFYAFYAFNFCLAGNMRWKWDPGCAIKTHSCPKCQEKSDFLWMKGLLSLLLNPSLCLHLLSALRELIFCRRLPLTHVQAHSLSHIIQYKQTNTQCMIPAQCARFKWLTGSSIWTV